MNVRFYKITSLFFAFFLAISCHSPKSEDAVSETKVDDTSHVVALVNEWNSANSSKDVEALGNLFDDEVVFYGSQLSREDCIDHKRKLFNNKPDFSQQIYGEVDVEKVSDAEMKCTFVKRVTVDGKTTDYPSYMVFKKNGEKWKISVEGDFVTDELLKQKRLKLKYANAKNYSFDVPVEIYGTIVAETFYGPPGYGENPDTDSKERYYLLLLDSPIDVIAKAGDEYSETTKGVTKMQLVVDSDFYNGNYLNKFVKLNGSLFYWFTGHHHTQALLDVKGAEIVEE